MEMESSVPPGFRFHPTEEELVGYYLQRKINSLKIDLDVIIDIDLYKIEPWDIQGRCNLGYDEQKEWYFFSHKDKKYPTGTRTNRATIAGFWKATGRDKAVLAKNGIIGMRKTLVFYQGRAPNGRKTDWIMHEYRLQTSELAPPHEEGWVVCRAFKKPTPNQRQGFEANWNYQYQPKYSYNTTLDNTNINIRPPPANNFQQQYFGSMQDLLSNNHIIFSDVQSTDDDQLPQLVSPNSISTNLADNTTVEANFQDNMTITSLVSQDFDDHDHDELRLSSSNNRNSRCSIDWKNLDNLFVHPQIADTTSFMHSSLSKSVHLPQNYDQDNRSNLLGCTFPDL